MATAAAAGVLFVGLGVAGRWWGLGRDWLATWGMAPIVGELVAVIMLTDPLVPRWPSRVVVAAALAAGSVAAALLARPTGRGELRELSAVGIVGAGLLTASGAAAGPTAMVAAAVTTSVVTTMATVLLLDRHAASPWGRPLLILGGLSVGTALAVAASELPDRPLLVAALIPLWLELLAMGVATRRTPWFVSAPWAFLAAWLVFASESLTGNDQWFAVPLGLTTLGMVGILRWDRRRTGVAPAATRRIARSWQLISWAWPSSWCLHSSTPSLGPRRTGSWPSPKVSHSRSSGSQLACAGGSLRERPRSGSRCCC